MSYKLEIEVNNKNKKPSIIKDKSFEFAIQTIDLYNLLKDNKEFVLSKQFLRSGTAIGALVREAEHAESTADFIHKMAIAQKEANETEYWIELLFHTHYIDKQKYDLIINNILEIKKLLASIIITSKKKLHNS